jgi:hypothetical protein
MAEKKVIELEVKTNTASLKSQLREAQNEVQTLADKFGATSAEAVNAAKRAAELKDAIGDAKALTDAFNPDAKFNALSSSIGGVLNGFQAFEGALGLVGVEGEAVQQTLLKVQSAMALSQGLQGLGEARDSFRQLGAVASNALKGIKTGLAATGIGLFVVALGLIVAYWDDIKAAVSGVSEEQKKLNANSQANLDIQKSKLTAIDSQENILKLQGKSEREILNIKIAQTDETIKAAKQQILNNERTAKAQIEASQRNKDILSGILQFMSLPLTLLLRTIDDAGKVFGKDFGLNKKFYEGLSGFVFDPEDTKKEIEAVKVETEKGLKELENTRAGFVLAVRAIDKTASDEKKATQKAIDDTEKAEKEKRRKEEEDAEDAFLKRGQKMREDNLENYQKNRDKELDIDNKTAEERIKIFDKEQAQRDADAEKEKQRLKSLQDAKYDIVRTGLSTIGNLATAFAGESEKEQKKAFEIQKAANIAGAIIDTIRATIGAFKSGNAIGGPILGFAQAGIAAAGGAVMIRQLEQSSFNGRGAANAPSNTGGNNNQAITPNFNIIGNQNQTQLAQLNQPPIKAYVVGSDVTTQQMLDKKKIQNATL